MAAVTTPLSSRASANLRFFGTGEVGGGGAPWFQPEKLSDPDFSVEAFVADLRQYAPLETLSGELEAYLATLKSKAGFPTCPSPMKLSASCLLFRPFPA